MRVKSCRLKEIRGGGRFPAVMGSFLGVRGYESGVISMACNIAVIHSYSPLTNRIYGRKVKYS